MGPDDAKKRGNPSKNYSPPIPPTRIPFWLIPDHFYVRFLDFPVLHFLPSFCQFVGPHWTPLDPIGTHPKIPKRGQNQHPLWKQPSKHGAEKVRNENVKMKTKAIAPSLHPPFWGGLPTPPKGILYGSYRGPIGWKTEKLDFRQKTNILLHMAIHGVLTWQDGAETHCGSNWTPCFQLSVLPNSGFH